MNKVLAAIIVLVSFAFGMLAMQVRTVWGETMGVSPNVMVMPVTTVSALPACNLALRGTVMLASDGLLPTFLGVIIGGGGVNVPVVCNGSNWIGF